MDKLGTYSSRYCYSVWLRHIVTAHKNGLPTKPRTIAELGPGNSLEIGLAGLISGAQTYYAFDIAKFATNDRNLKVFDEIVTLFRNRADIPGEDEFARVKPYLDSYRFPKNIYDDNYLEKMLREDRLERIRNSLLNMNDDDSCITYEVPWDSESIIKKESVDMIYSQAVLEHIDNLSDAYKAMCLWLKPEGFISHQIDFKCHGTAQKWNGHWSYSDSEWNDRRSRETFLLNREPHSHHLKYLEQTGFKIICDDIIKYEQGILRNQLAGKFKNISDEDFFTGNAFIQASRNCCGILS